MNRLLLIPCLTFASLFAAWSLFGPDQVHENYMQTKAIDVSWESGANASTKNRTQVTVDTSQVSNQILSMWASVPGRSIDMNRFSRSKIVPVPGKGLVASVDFGGPQEIENLLVGAMIVTQRKDSISFPVVFNQESSTASIFANRQWHSYREWLQTQDGVFK